MVPGPAAGALAGCRILVPRPPHQASALSARIRAAGGEAVEAATIRTVPGDHARLASAVRDLAADRFTGVCLTSANGVHALATAFADAGIDPGAALGRLALLGAVGPRTAGLVGERLGAPPTVVPETATAGSLGAALPPGGGRVLLPRGDLAARDLDRALADAGWTPVPVVAYRTVTSDALDPAVLVALGAGTIDLLAFTAASTVRGFVTLLGDRPWRGRVVSIGPVTSAACRELGLEVVEEADPHDLDGLVAALVRAAGTRPGRGRRS